MAMQRALNPQRCASSCARNASATAQHRACMRCQLTAGGEACKKCRERARAAREQNKLVPPDDSVHDDCMHGAPRQRPWQAAHGAVAQSAGMRDMPLVHRVA
jgi:hypothetical protein